MENPGFEAAPTAADALRSFLADGGINPAALPILRASDPEALMRQAAEIADQLVTEHPSPQGVVNRLQIIDIAARGHNPSLWDRMSGFSPMVVGGENPTYSALS